MITKITPWNNSGQAVEPYSWFCCAGANAFLRVTKSRWAVAEGRWCCPSDASFPELPSLCLSVRTHTHPFSWSPGKTHGIFLVQWRLFLPHPWERSGCVFSKAQHNSAAKATSSCQPVHRTHSTSLGFCLLALKGKLHLGHQGKAEGLWTKTVLPDLKYIYI